MPMNTTPSSHHALFQTVVYATDFSLHSQNAGLYASFLARQFGATLLVSHAFHLSQAALEVEIASHLKSLQRLDLEAFLAGIAKRLGNGKIRSASRLVEGDPRKAIPRVAEQNASAMIVLGTHGGGRIERGIIGSTAEGILRSTRCPCLTVGPRVPALLPEAAPFKRILYATDLDPAVAHAAQYAVALTQECHTEIDVLHVVHPHEVKRPGGLDEDEVGKEFYAALDNLVPAQAKALCTPRSFVEVGSAHVEILRHIEEYSVDLLVLGIRKTAHIWMESQRSGAFHIVAQARCPVMTVVG